MLVELATGDAYAGGFEYAAYSLIRNKNDLSGYVQHPTHNDLKPGCYTDDTQMTIAVVEAMLSGEAWTRELLADAFVRCFKRDQRVGYAGRFYEFLLTVEDGADFLARIKPYSDKAGAAMRGHVLGTLESIDQVREWSELQAKLTHDTTPGINSAIASALITHYFVWELGVREDVGRFLESEVVGRWSRPFIGNVDGKGINCVHAAVTALLASDSMSELLRNCVAFGGDVDTVAAIALAAGSCSVEIEQDLPQVLLDGLENGSYGREFLEKLDCRLMDRVPRFRSAG